MFGKNNSPKKKGLLDHVLKERESLNASERSKWGIEEATSHAEPAKKPELEEKMVHIHVVPKDAPEVSLPLAFEDSTPIHPDHHFHLESGHELRSLNDLIESLSSMPESVWIHHVKEDRNDFANWIEYVFKNKPLADKVRTAHTPQELHKLLFRLAI